MGDLWDRVRTLEEEVKGLREKHNNIWNLLVDYVKKVHVLEAANANRADPPPVARPSAGPPGPNEQPLKRRRRHDRDLE